MTFFIRVLGNGGGSSVLPLKHVPVPLKEGVQQVFVAAVGVQHNAVINVGSAGR